MMKISIMAKKKRDEYDETQTEYYNHEAIRILGQKKTTTYNRKYNTFIYPSSGPFLLAAYF